MAGRFNLVQLRAFVTLAEMLNFTAAAERLHVTQPTLSGTIRLLESLVGARLFDRDTRKVRLTPVGAEFVSIALRVLTEAGRAEVELGDLVNARRGTVRLAALSMLVARFLMPAIDAFRRAHPDVRLELLDVSSEQCRDLLHRGQADIAVYTVVEADAEIDTLIVGEQSIVALLRDDHPLTAGRSVDWRRLLREPVIALRARTQLGLYGEAKLLKAGLAIRPSYSVDQAVTAAGLVRSGLGIAVMARHSADLMAHDGLTMRPLLRPRVARPICVAAVRGRELLPAAAALREAIVRSVPNGKGSIRTYGT